jgi:hypothetical protein
MGDEAVTVNSWPHPAFDADPELLAAMCGLAGIGGQRVSAAFDQGGAADTLRPGPVLAVLTGQASSRVGRLSDDELTGVLQAARRLACLAEYQQTLAVAELARRREREYEAAFAAGKPAGCREGEFPGEELAIELTETRAYAGLRIDTATELTARLPRTLAGMAGGSIDLGRAMTIASVTRSLSDADAAYADEVLAAAAPDKRPDQLARKAAALELKLAPEVVAARKEQARQLDRRVEVRREPSGNASLAGRELDTADVMASKAYLDMVALRLRASGLVAGTLPQLRALALTDLTQGRNPLDRIQPPAEPASPAPASGDPAPLPALVNLLVPAATLLGWGTAPAQAGDWGLLDAKETQALVRAASRHPRTRWCLTLTGPDGTALAHGCAPGQHPWPVTSPPHEGTDGPSPPGGPDPPQLTQLPNLLGRLRITLEPLARSACDHPHAEHRYVPSRVLRHYLRARHQACTAPACNTQAVHCDNDHTVPYPDGPTCECNLNPKCRRHHRTKQAPGWQVNQPTPATATWTTPAGRTHTTEATVYDV